MDTAIKRAKSLGKDRYSVVLPGNQEFVQPDMRPLNDDVYELKENYSVILTDWADHSIFRMTLRGPIHDSKTDFVFRGTVTDGASVPQIAWSLGFTPDGACRAAAAIHDEMYRCKGYVTIQQKDYSGEFIESNHRFSREEADLIFYALLIEGGVPEWKAKTMFYAVRFMGWKYW